MSRPLLCPSCLAPLVRSGTRPSPDHARAFELWSCTTTKGCKGAALVEPDDDDVRPVKADSRETFDLFQGARQRGFSEAQLEYLGGCVGITWAKAYRAGQKAGPDA